MIPLICTRTMVNECDNGDYGPGTEYIKAATQGYDTMINILFTRFSTGHSQDIGVKGSRYFDTEEPSIHGS